MNSTLKIVLDALAAVAAIAVNPAVGLAASGQKIAQLVSFVATLGSEGEEAHEALIDFTAKIKALDENNAPIPVEVWDGWESRLDAAHARLQG